MRLEASEQGGRQTAPLPQEIIVIDDDRALLELTLLTVRAGGYRAVGFHDPLDALMWASDAEPTCIVSDLKIPGVEGLDLVAAFCALNRHAVIIVSAFVDVRMTVDAMRLGVDDVLPKPASDENLIRAIEKAIIDSNIGLTPSNNGEQIRLSIPPLTEERRKELVKQVRQEAETARISLRNARRDAVEAFKKAQKEGMSEDEAKDGETQAQKLLDKFTKSLDAILDNKEKEIMTV